MYRTDKQFMTNPATATCRVYVGSLPKTTTPQDLEQKFQVHGKILGLVLQSGFAFVQFENEAQAHAAIQAEHLSMFYGRKIIVKQALDKSQKAAPNQFQNKKGGNTQANQQGSSNQFSPKNQQKSFGGQHQQQQNRFPQQSPPNQFQQQNQQSNQFQQQNQPPNQQQQFPQNQQSNQFQQNQPSNQFQQQQPPQNQQQQSAPSQSFEEQKQESTPPVEEMQNPPPQEETTPQQQQATTPIGPPPSIPSHDPPLSHDGKRNRKRKMRDRDRDRYPMEPYRDDYYPPREDNYPPVGYGAPPIMDQPPPPERNDCEIIVVSKVLTKYAEYIEQRLKSLGLIVDLLFPNEDVPIGKVLANISSRGCLYAILVMPQNEEQRSLTLNILHGIPQEHRNMPLEDALILITRNFDAYMRGDKSVAENQVAGQMTISDRHPTSMQLLLNLLAENRQLTTSQYDKLLKYLQERKELQYQHEVAEGVDQESQESNSKQTELQNRIMNILNKSESAPTVAPANESSSQGGSSSPAPLLKDPSVQKALDSLLGGEMFKNIAASI